MEPDFGSKVKAGKRRQKNTKGRKERGRLREERTEKGQADIDTHKVGGQAGTESQEKSDLQGNEGR